MLRAAHYKADAVDGPAAGKSPPKHRPGGILDLALTAADKYALSLLPTALKGTGLASNDGPATDYRAVPQHPSTGIPPAFKMQRAAGNPLLHNYSPSAVSQDTLMQQSGVDSRVATSWDASLKEILAALEPESRTLKPAKLRDHKYPNQNHGMPTNPVIPTPRRELDEALMTLPGGTRRGKSSVPAYAAAFKGLSRQSRRPELQGNAHAGSLPSAVDVQYDMVPSVKLAWVGPVNGTYSTTGFGSSPKKYTSQLVGRVSPHYAGTPGLQQSMSTPAGNQDPLHLPDIANGNGHAAAHTAGSFRGSNSVLPSYQTWAHSATPTPAAAAGHSTQTRRALPYVSTNTPSLAKPLTVQYHPVLKSPSVGPGACSLYGAQSGGSPASAWGSRGTPQRPATEHGSPHQAAGAGATADPGRVYPRNPYGTQPHRLPHTPPEVAAEVARLRHAQELDGVINGVRSDLLQAAAPRLDAPAKSKFLQMYEDPSRPLAKLNPKQLLGDASQLSQQARRNRPPSINTDRQPQSSTDGGPPSSPSSSGTVNRSPMYERRLRPLPSDTKSVSDAVGTAPTGSDDSDGGALVNVHLQPPELPGGDAPTKGGMLPELPDASAEAASTGRSTPRSSQLEREDTVLTDADLPPMAAGDAEADYAPEPSTVREDAAGSREAEEAGIVAGAQAELPEIFAEMDAEQPGIVTEARVEMPGLAAGADREQPGVPAETEAEKPGFAADVEAEQPGVVVEALAEQLALAAEALAKQTGPAAEAEAEKPAIPAEMEAEQPGPSTRGQEEQTGPAAGAEVETSPSNGAPTDGAEELPLPSPTVEELQPEVTAGVLEGMHPPAEPSGQEPVRQSEQQAGPDSTTQQTAASQDGMQQDGQLQPPELPLDAGGAASAIPQGAGEVLASEPPAEPAGSQRQAAGEQQEAAEEQQQEPCPESGVSTEPEQSANGEDGGTGRPQQEKAAEEACAELPTGAEKQDAPAGTAIGSSDPDGTASGPDAVEEDAIAQQGSSDQAVPIVETEAQDGAEPGDERPATASTEPLLTAEAVTAARPSNPVVSAAEPDAPAVGVAGGKPAEESPDASPHQLGAAPEEEAGPRGGSAEADIVAAGAEASPLEGAESAAVPGYSLPPGVTPEMARASALCIQSHARGYQARRRLMAMRKERDAAAAAPPPPPSPPLPPSSPARNQVAYELPPGVTPEMARAAVVRIQSHARGYFARRHVAELREGREAGEAALATAVNAVAASKADGYELPPGVTADQAESAAIRVQAHMRGHLARRRVKRLRAERTLPPPPPDALPAEVEAELAPPRASGEGAGGQRPADDDTALREAGEAVSTGAGAEAAATAPTDPEEVTIDALKAALADEEEEEEQEGAGEAAQQSDIAAAGPIEPAAAALEEPLDMSDPAAVAAAAAAAAAAKSAATRVLDDGGAHGSDGGVDTTAAADQASEEASMARLAASSARTSAMFQGAGAEMRYSDDEASALELMDNLDGLLQGDDEAAAAAAAVAAATAPADGEIVSISADGVSEPQSLGSGTAANAANPMDVTEPGGVRVLAGKYEVQHVVGEGAYGMVMKCKVRGTEPVQWVAIKEFKIDDNDPDAEDVKRTSLREVSVLEALHHPHVVGFVDKFMVGDRLFIVMEFLPCNLLELLEAQPGGMDRDAVRLIMFQLCSAIAFIHSKCMVYRDIKPENLLVDEHGTVKLCDFGFARYLPTGPKSHLTDYVATRWYRAPELLLGPPYRDALGKHVQYMYGPPVDMWAVGCLMGELLDGEPLFAGDSDLDQLYRVQQILGPMAPGHQYMFYANPHNTGIVFNIKQPVTLASRYRGKVSDVELSFMAGLLEMDPDKRLTGEQCLQHPYLLDLAVAAQALPTPTPTDSNNPTNTTISLEGDASGGGGSTAATEAQDGDGELPGAGKAAVSAAAEADGAKPVSPYLGLRLSDSREGLGSRGSEKAGSLTRAAGSLTRGGRSLSRGAISPVHPPVSSSPVPGSGPGPQRGGSKLLASENGQVVIVEGVEEEEDDACGEARRDAATRLSTVKSVSALPIAEIEPAE